jgi:GT2 family glycosyltransferase
MRTAVIIPSIGRITLLDRCLASLADSRRRADQIFVVFQGQENQARSAEITDRYPGVCVVWCPAIGASAARNFGARACDADLLLFIDDDCTADSAWVTSYKDAFSTDPSLELAGGRVLLGGNDENPPVRLGFQGDTTPRRITSRRNPVGTLDRGGNLAIRRKTFLDLRGFDEGIGPGTPFQAAEDTDLVYRAMRAGAEMAYIPDAVVYHAQWRSPSDAARVEGGYGIGLGAFIAGHARRGDFYAVSLAPRLIWHLGCRPLARGLVRRNMADLRSGLRYLSCIPWGFMTGLFRKPRLLTGSGET